MPHTSSRPRILARAALLLACGCGPPGASAGDRPDLLLVTVDTLRPDVLECYGGAPGAGAAACGIGESGVRYTWAFSTAPYTAPSVGSILTSRYPSEHGLQQVSRRPIRQDVASLPALLSSAGYASAAFVCNPALARVRGLDRGFDLYDDEMPRRDPARPGFAERVAADATDAALAWLGEAPSPFFLWVHYQDPHGPYAPPGLEPPASDPPGQPPLRLLKNASGWQGIPDYQALGGLRSEAAYRERYAVEIRYLDSHLARLLAGLRAASPRHAVLLTADHGEAFGEDDYFFAHGHSLALDQIRVPMLWRPVNSGVSGVVAEPVSTLDVAPTLLAAAGLVVPDEFAGRPLPLPEEPGPGGRSFFAEHSHRLAVIDGRRYFARDLGNLRGVRDRNSSGLLQPLPPRVAELTAQGGWPAYRKSGASDVDGRLRRLLAEFGRARPAPGEAEPVAGELRERLRALGYLEGDS